MTRACAFTRMTGLDHESQIGDRDRRVERIHGEALMPEQRLDGAQVGTAAQQMRWKRTKKCEALQNRFAWSSQSLRAVGNRRPVIGPDQMINLPILQNYEQARSLLTVFLPKCDPNRYCSGMLTLNCFNHFTNHLAEYSTWRRILGTRYNLPATEAARTFGHAGNIQFGDISFE